MNMAEAAICQPKTESGGVTVTKNQTYTVSLSGNSLPYSAHASSLCSTPILPNNVIGVVKRVQIYGVLMSTSPSFSVDAQMFLSIPGMEIVNPYFDGAWYTLRTGLSFPSINVETNVFIVNPYGATGVYYSLPNVNYGTYETKNATFNGTIPVSSGTLQVTYDKFSM